jgi:hypothetical protein
VSARKLIQIIEAVFNQTEPRITRNIQAGARLKNAAIGKTINVNSYNICIEKLQR